MRPMCVAEESTGASEVLEDKRAVSRSMNNGFDRWYS